MTTQPKDHSTNGQLYKWITQHVTTQRMENSTCRTWTIQPMDNCINGQLNQWKTQQIDNCINGQLNMKQVNTLTTFLEKKVEKQERAIGAHRLVRLFSVNTPKFIHYARPPVKVWSTSTKKSNSVLSENAKF